MPNIDIDIGSLLTLPDGAIGTVAVIENGEAKVMTGAPGTIGCGPWIYPVTVLVARRSRRRRA